MRGIARWTVQLSIEVQHGGDEREVGEGLGKVADLFTGGIDLLRVEAEVIRVGEHLGESQPTLM